MFIWSTRTRTATTTLRTNLIASLVAAIGLAGALPTAPVAAAESARGDSAASAVLPIWGDPALPSPRLDTEHERRNLLGSCGVYHDEAEFDLEHGPFARPLGNFEDFELGNAPSGSFCVVDAGVLDCGGHSDPFGVCAGGTVDVGDIMTGLEIRSKPYVGGGKWEILHFGDTAPHSKTVMANYFGDSLELKFPNAALPVGCEASSPGPNVAGFKLWNPFGTIAVFLKDGTRLDFATGTDFIGVCCDQEIDSIEVLHDFAANVDDVRWGWRTPTSACLTHQFAGLTAGVVDDLSGDWKRASLPLGSLNDSADALFPVMTALGSTTLDAAPDQAPLRLYRVLLGGTVDAGNVLRATKAGAGVELSY